MEDQGAASQAEPERIRAQDPHAIESAVHAYLGQILRAARAAGLAPLEAEDVTQATFGTFIEKAPRFEGRSSVRTWLFGILYMKLREARRSLGRERQVDDIDEVIEQRFHADGRWRRPPADAGSALQRRETGEMIAACLDHVPVQQKMAFVLREVEELPTEEICNVLDVTRTNLGVLLFRCRNRLRECLEQKGVTG